MTVELKIGKPVTEERRPHNTFEVIVVVRDGDGDEYTRTLWGGYDEIVPKLSILSAFFELDPYQSYWPEDVLNVLKAKKLDSEWYKSFVGADIGRGSLRMLNRPHRVIVYWYDECNGDKYHVEVNGLLTEKRHE